ncbi:MAG TPA: hypothetical protein VE978_06815 [Chitinophagales bacterium]|nr:hypothetical protein [Chitinophagales bacterium]
MKKIFCLATAILFFLGCDQSATSGKNNDQLMQEQSKTGTVTHTKGEQSQGSINPLSIFTLSDAEKILGEPAHLTDSSMTIEENVSIYKCAYTANAKDPKTGKTGVIYFLFEQYSRDSSAEKVYTSIKTANENHGIKELHDMGDEAYFHTDGENFYFIMVRKGNKMFRIKVNKITGTTSLDEFNLIAKYITDAL